MLIQGALLVIISKTVLPGPIPQELIAISNIKENLVEGEKNQLITLESSLIDMKAPAAESDVQQLNQLWGSLASHGESRRKIQSEMANFEVKTKDRYEIVRKSCITGNSTTIVLSS
uniref:Uncharacterized protein n=1 Tax=Lygus hesperus TaxID=30085 RepID=A0A146LVG9_LYGHE